MCFLLHPLIRELSIVITMSVCVCLLASVSPESCVRSLPDFLFTLPMPVTRSSFGGVVIRYVLLVLWMMSYFLICQGCSMLSGVCMYYNLVMILSVLVVVR